MGLVVEHPQVGLDRLHCKRIDAPPRCFEDRAEAVEWQWYVWSVAIGYQTLRSVDQPLAARAERQRIIWAQWMQRHVHEELRKVKLVFVNLGTRSAYPVIFPIAHQFSENAHLFTEMKIAKNQIALQQVSAWAFGL